MTRLSVIECLPRQVHSAEEKEKKQGGAPAEEGGRKREREGAAESKPEDKDSLLRERGPL